MFSGCLYQISPGQLLDGHPQGKRPIGTPKTTWRRTIEAELKELDMTWGEAETELDGEILWRLYAPPRAKRIGG